MPTCSSSSENGSKDICQDENKPICDKFYLDAKKYWSAVSPTIDGMLGGFSDINLPDINGSLNFLKYIFKTKPSPSNQYCLDCGAGIGRITKHLLLSFFDKVDLVEQDEIFSKQAISYIGQSTKLGEIYNLGLQDFTPKPKKYDVIWCQWVLSHLTDEDLVSFLIRAATGLKKNGVIIIKENVTSSYKVEVDKTDSSATRPLKLFQNLIKKSKLRTLHMLRQKEMPDGLYPVYMIALKPINIK